MKIRCLVAVLSMFAFFQSVAAQTPLVQPPPDGTLSGPKLELGEIPAASSNQAGLREGAAVAAPSPAPSPISPMSASAFSKQAPVTAPQMGGARAAEDRALKVKSAGVAEIRSGAQPRKFDSIQKNAKPERVEFRRRPVQVVLGPTERLITFPHPVSISLPSGSESFLTLQIIGRTAYASLVAQSFGTIRATAEDLVTGLVIPLNISGVEVAAGVPEEIEIFYPDEQALGATKKTDADDDDDRALDMVELTRFASQFVYAPKRLIPFNSSVYSIPIDAKVFEGLFRGIRTSAVPIGQWRSGDLYVTAVQLTNLESKTISLDLERIRGNWIAATLQNRALHASGSDFDTTTVYLVCGQPFYSCK